MENKPKKLGREIIHLAWPATMEMVLHMMLMVFDTAMVGHLNAAALSAVGFAGQLFYAIIFIFEAIGIGTVAIVARYTGSGEHDKASRAATKALQLSIIVGLLVGSLLYILANRIFILTHAEKEVVLLGSQYLRIVFVAAFFMLPMFVGTAIFRGMGNTRVPMMVAAVANTINIIGDYVLIFGKFGLPVLGVKGAALATVLGQFVGAVILFYLLFFGKKEVALKWKELLKWDQQVMKQIIRFSLPALLEELVNNSGRILGSWMVIQLGTVAFAAHQVAVTVESLSYMPGYGFAIAASTLVGQRMGAGNEKMAEQCGWQTSRYGVCFMSLIGIVFFFFPHVLMQLFTQDIEVVAAGAASLRVGALEQPTVALTMILGGALRGAGDTRGAFWISLLSVWCVRLPLIYCVVFVFRWGLTAVWAVTVVQFFLQSTLFILRFHRGKWKEIQIG